MTTALFFDPACIDHDPGLGHPEQPARLVAVRDALAAPAFDGLDRRMPPPATVDQLARAHDRAYVDGVLAAVPASGQVMLDADTFMSPGSGVAALSAAGAACAAVDAVLAGEVANAFAPSGRLVITPNMTAPWAFACSTMWPSRRTMRAPFMV